MHTQQPVVDSTAPRTAFVNVKFFGPDRQATYEEFVGFCQTHNILMGRLQGTDSSRALVLPVQTTVGEVSMKLLSWCTNRDNVEFLKSPRYNKSTL